ncbi:hypothetical protein LguiA_018258 [Lonicera macranthoides]
MTEMPLWFSLSLLSFSLLLVLFNTLNNKTQKIYKNLPPTPPSLPIIGHLHLLKDPLHQTLHSLSLKYGPIIRLRFGLRKVLIVTSPQLVEECFTKNDIVFANRPRLILEKHLNYDYTTMGAAPYGDLWRRLRRVSASELFSPARLAATAEVRQEVVRLMAREVAKGCGEGVGKVNLKLKFSEVSINVISMLMMGKRYYGEDVADPIVAVIFRDLMKEFLELLKLSNVGDFLPFLRWLDLQGMERRMMELREKMDKFLQEIVDEHRRNLCVGKEFGGSEEARSLTMVDNLLLLQKTEPEFYPDQIIKGLIMIMLVAGTESSHLTMEWAMSLLLNHPQTLQKLKIEIDNNIGHHRLLEEDDLCKLPHLQNIITETLRLYTPIPLLVPHHASEDCIVGGYDVPKGTMLLVNAWAIHRDPKVWEDPTEFKPDRFEEECGPFDIVPFGTGRRGCPGVGLANRMVGLVLGTLIQGFEWETIGGETVDMSSSAGISLSKLKPLEVLCTPRSSMIKHLF